MFLNELVTIIETPRAKLYDKTKYKQLFNEMDEDKNGSLSKSQMAVLIKKTFSVPDPKKSAKKLKE